MKKILFAVLFLLLMVGQGLGATYHVAKSGSDGNDGAESTPWASPNYALSKATTGDTVVIESSKTDPIRGHFITQATGVTIQGSSSTNRAYISGGIDVSHGATKFPAVYNGDMEGWLTSSSLWRVSSSGEPIAQESTIVDSGNYSIRATRAATTIYIVINAYLEKNTEYTLSFAHYETAANYRFKVVGRNLTGGTDNGYYLQNDMSWDAASYTIDGSTAWNSNGAWAPESLTFTSTDSGKYTFTFQQAYTTTSYLDSVSVVPTQTTYEWSDQGGDVYALSNVGFISGRVLCKSLTFATHGLDSLRFVDEAASLEACQSTVGTYYYDSSAEVLYYHLASGEIISALHLEASYTDYVPEMTSQQHVLHIAHDDDVSNINVYCGDGNGFYVIDVSPSLTHTSSFCNYSNDYSVNGASASPIIKYFEAAYTRDEDGCSTNSGATPSYAHGRIHHTYDDGMQSTTGGHFSAYDVFVHDNGVEGIADNSAFVNEGTDSGMTVINCTALRAYGRGFYINGTGTATVTNSIAYDTVVTDVYDSGLGTLIASYNCYGTKNATWSGTNELSATNPLIRADGSLAYGSSPCIGTGIIVDGVNNTGEADQWGNYVILNPAPDMGASQWNQKNTGSFTLNGKGTVGAGAVLNFVPAN